MSQSSLRKTERSEQTRSRITKTAILEAAVEEFANLGFDGATTRGIAARADVNPALIAHHFGNKDALWKAVAAHLMGMAAERLRKRREDLKGVEHRTVLRLLLREFVLLSADLPNLNRFMVQANAGSAKRMHWLAERFLQPGGAMMADVIVDAQAAKLLPPGDPMHIRFIFLCAAASIFTFAAEFEELTGTNPHQPEILERHIDLVLDLFEQPDQDQSV